LESYTKYVLTLEEVVEFYESLFHIGFTAWRVSVDSRGWAPPGLTLG
jgi:hypothetical protein